MYLQNQHFQHQVTNIGTLRTYFFLPALLPQITCRSISQTAASENRQRTVTDSSGRE
jgi:hypothetical protein